VSKPDPGTAGWDAVAETGDVYAAELMALRLRAAGLDARVVDQSFRQEPVPIARSLAVVRVFVPASRAEEARRLLAEAEGGAEDAEDLGREEP
jgi:hypothetical protein